MTTIDLNADLGEGCDNDEALLALVSSANIACGWHAGDVNTMRQTTAWALREGVSIGAHPSFPDRENFGRTELHLPPEEIYAGVLFQIGGLSAIVRAQASRDRPLAAAIVRAVRDFDPSLVVFGLAGGELVKAARELGLQAKEEVFADRGYNADGSLVKRGTPGALIDDEAAALDQTLTMVREQRVKAIDGTWVPIHAQTVCLHGDGAHALAFARRIRERLGSEGITVRAGA